MDVPDIVLRLADINQPPATDRLINGRDRVEEITTTHYVDTKVQISKKVTQQRYLSQNGGREAQKRLLRGHDC